MMMSDSGPHGDSYNMRGGFQADPYAQGGYHGDSYAQGGFHGDSYGQGGRHGDSYAQGGRHGDSYPRTGSPMVSDKHAVGHSGVSNMSKELFFHVMIQGVEEHPLHAAANWISGVMRSSTYKDTKLLQDHMKDVIFCAEKTMAMHGWRCFAHPVMMPPIPGQTEWRNYVQVGRAGPPTLVVVRAQLTGRNRTHDDTLFCCGDCCDTIVPPKAPQSQHEKNDISHTMMHELRHLKEGIQAQVDVMDATSVFQSFKQRGWSDELCTTAVQQARTSGETHHQMYGASDGTGGRYAYEGAGGHNQPGGGYGGAYGGPGGQPGGGFGGLGGGWGR